MSILSSRNLGRVLAGGAFVLLAAGSLILGSTLLAADEAPPGEDGKDSPLVPDFVLLRELPERETPALVESNEPPGEERKDPPPVPDPAVLRELPGRERPSEDSATSIPAALEILRESEPIDFVVSAVTSGDVPALLSRTRGGNFCEVRHREGPLPQCVDTDSYPGIYLQTTTKGPVLRPADLVDRLLNAVLAEGAEVTLIAKLSTEERYYIVFKAPRAVDFQGVEWDSLGVVIDPSAETPVLWLYPIPPDNNGLEWLQSWTEGLGYKFELLAPETVRDWPGL